ncbi:Pyrroline-5-carboxylate reductase [Labilithrix luteola]|uniref:Pyrroline-5-carboxylate reductase n=2 Tax=Labilithrix luteola TaxID=1391654 RepID=A0A0K1PLC5_9BACT|nr:Pyrroline-5-carboxylate reductase [Labilithrix luteola]
MDAGSGRAVRLAEELGGRATTSPAELVKASDIVLLVHPPNALTEVAERFRSRAPRIVVSVLSRVSQADVGAAYPRSSVVRVEPSTLVSVRSGAILVVEPPDGATRTAFDEARKLFDRLGTVVVVDEARMVAASAISGVGPALWSLLIEAQVDAGIRHGLTAEQASELAVATMAGSAELLAAERYDTLLVRRAVMAPGGATARGLASLEASGARVAMAKAIDEIIGPQERPRRSKR